MAMEYREHELEDLRAMRDRLLNTIGWYTGMAERGGTVEPDKVVQRLQWVLDTVSGKAGNAITFTDKEADFMRGVFGL